MDIKVKYLINLNLNGQVKGFVLKMMWNKLVIYLFSGDQMSCLICVK